MIMTDHFLCRPELSGWTTTDALQRMPIDLSEIDLPKNLKKSAFKSIKDLMGERSYRPVDQVKGYLNGLKKLEPRDYVILTTCDTLYSKPPLEINVELPPTHPSNKKIPEICKRLKQCQLKTGNSSYVAVIDPPYVLSIIDSSKSPNIEVHDELKGFYLQHSFKFWDNLNKQEETYLNMCEKAKIYEKEGGKEYPIPKWNRKTERLRLRILESVVTNTAIEFVTKKCNDSVLFLLPNSSNAKKRIKRDVFNGICKYRPEFEDLDEIIDVVDLVKFNRGYKIGLSCSNDAINKFTTIIENLAGFKYEKERLRKPVYDGINPNQFAHACPIGPYYCEWAPESGEWCEYRGDKRHCSEPYLDEVLKMNGNDKEIKRVIGGKGLLIPNVRSLVKELNLKLNENPKPLPLPITDEKPFDIRASDVEKKDEIEFFLDKMGVLEVSSEVKVAGDVGKACHECIYKTATSIYKPAMERSFVIEYLVDVGPLKGRKVKIHETPDLVLYSDEVGILPIDFKSSKTPFVPTVAYTPHTRQLATYSLGLESHFKDEVANPNSNFGCIVYLHDIQNKRPTIVPILTGADSVARRDAINKISNFIFHNEMWKENPEKFFEYYRNHDCKDCIRNEFCKSGVEKYKNIMR